MIKKVLSIVLLNSFIFQTAKSQDSIPLLSGKVYLSIENGTFDCDFTLSNIPRIKDYFIRINSGMNIRYFKNVDANELIYFEKSFNDTNSTGETSAYYFPDNTGKGKFLPRTVQFRYTGMYPVISDTIESSVEDWKGNIAFNGYSVRADGAQSAWYPFLYDIKKDKEHDHVKYDIEIICKDCNSIYVNGSLPVTGSKAHLKSDAPQELMLYAGDYEVSNVNGTYFLNPDMDEKQIEEFGKMTNVFKKYYEEKLLIPYKQAITYIQTTPTSKENAWMFVSYPSIINIGHGEYGMKRYSDPKRSDSFKGFIAHELGHYYFGTFKVFNSELGDMMNEGFAEYMSLKITEKLVSDSLYIKKINEKLKRLKNFSAIPFASIKSKSDYHNRELYVYNYAPLIFVAIEKEIGELKMWEWLKTILESKTDFTNYLFLEQTLSAVLQDKNKLELIKTKYCNSEKAIENVTEQVRRK